MASTRLRKAFRYPDSDNEDESRQEMDEEEQERVISVLQNENEQRNVHYITIFTALALVSTIACLPLGFSSDSTSFQKLLCFLSVVSLVCTASMMWFPTPQSPGANVKRHPLGTHAESLRIRKYVRGGNTSICALLVVSAFIIRDADQASSSLWVLCLVPALVLLIVTVVQKTIASVDLRELEALRYEYKGA